MWGSGQLDNRSSVRTGRSRLVVLPVNTTSNSIAPLFFTSGSPIEYIPEYSSSIAEAAEAAGVAIAAALFRSPVCELTNVRQFNLLTLIIAKRAFCSRARAFVAIQ